MQSPKKLKPLSAISCAVAATMGAHAAHGAALSLYYDNIEDVTTGQAYSYATTGGDYSQIPTTINISQGDTLEFGIDVVVTNNVNPDAGKATGTPGHTVVQPSYLGLSTLSIVVPSSDTNASQLVPNTFGAPTQSFAGVPDYNSTESLNNQGGLGSSVGPNNNPGGFVPVWGNNTLGDVSPASATGGDVGDHFAIFQGNGATNSNTLIGANTIAEYGAATATFGNATDFFDSLSYTASGAGIVTLSPAVLSSGTSYWTNTRPGSATVTSGYIAQTFTRPGDVIGTLPILQVNIASHAERAMFYLEPFPFPIYGPSLGSLTVTGGDGSYGVAQLTGLNATTGYGEANGFNPGIDEEIYALDVLVNGVQANAAQIRTLLNVMEGGGGYFRPPEGLTAAATYAGLGVTHDASPFGSQYNLFLDADSPPSGDNFLSFGFSNGGPDLTGYTVSAIAVVPEPMSLSLLALGSLGLLGRRPRRYKSNP
jgi:hypothetical protein